MVGCSDLQPQLLILYIWGGTLDMFMKVPAVGMCYLPKQKTQTWGGGRMDTKAPGEGVWVWSQDGPKLTPALC